MIKIFQNENQIANEIANLVVNQIKNKKNTTLGCPSGRSLKKTYNFIGKLSYKKKIDLSNVKIFMMDEYVVKRNNKFYLCNSKLHYSCVGFAHKVIKKLFNYKKSNNNKLKTSNIFFPDVNNPKKYDEIIKKSGGIDIFFLASGSTDGHVAFNNINTSLNSSTHIIKLSKTTRKDNLKTFNKAKSLSDIPLYGVTVGLKTIYKYSKTAILVLAGKEKRIATSNIIHSNKFVNNWPSTIIYKCKKQYIFIEKNSIS